MNDPLDKVRIKFIAELILTFTMKITLTQEKTTSTVEVTTNFVKKFKGHFEKKLNNNFGLDSFRCYTDLLSSSTVEVVFAPWNILIHTKLELRPSLFIPELS